MYLCACDVSCSCQSPTQFLNFLFSNEFYNDIHSYTFIDIFSSTSSRSWHFSFSTRAFLYKETHLFARTLARRTAGSSLCCTLDAFLYLAILWNTKHALFVYCDWRRICRSVLHSRKKINFHFEPATSFSKNTHFSEI